jgi:hypothetical protein
MNAAWGPFAAAASTLEHPVNATEQIALIAAAAVAA